MTRFFTRTNQKRCSLMSEKIICSVFKSLTREGMYLYIEKKKGFDSIPDALRSLFGTEKLAMTLVLAEDKQLARISVKDVIQAIREKGFYLQMPPKASDEMQVVAEKNTLLSRG